MELAHVADREKNLQKAKEYYNLALDYFTEERNPDKFWEISSNLLLAITYLSGVPFEDAENYYINIGGRKIRATIVK